MINSTHNDRFSSCSDMREINEAKVANILSYLDDAVTTHSSSGYTTAVPLTVSTLQQNTTHASSVMMSERQVVPCHSGVSVMSMPSGGAQETYVGIKNKIDKLNFERDEMHRENQELRRRLQAVHQREGEFKSEIQASVKQDMAELRQELATTKKKSAAQIQKLSEEKDQLQRCVEATSTQLRNEMRKREEESQKMEAANAAALAALKGKWQAQERAAREKWKVAEAKRIKESTLQSLEPDIVLLLNRHKAEQARLREEYENELRHRDEVIAAKDASVEELKSRLQRDAESTLSREQFSFQTRLHEETERVRRQLEEERRQEKSKRDQMESFFEEEKAALQREVSRLGRELLELKATQTKEQVSFHELVAKEVSRISSESNEILSGLKEKLMLEHRHRESEFSAQNAMFLHTKEQELRKQMEIDRDAAIAKVVQKLEEEHVKALTSARGSDGLLRERYAQLNNDNERLRVELELVREQLQAAIANKKEKEKELAQVQAASDFSDKRVKCIEDRIRSQYEAQFSALDNVWQTKLNEVETQHVKDMCESQRRIDTIQQDIAMERSRLEQEQRTMEQRHHAELSQINERVLVAMTKKDNTIQSQGEQILVLQETVQLREQELQRHRTLLE